MKVLIDGDGCPVIDITVSLCNKNGIECIILCDTSHFFDKKGAKTVMISKGNDSVDFALVNMAEKGDIVVTQDYGLAAMCIAKQARPISQNGLLYTDENIDGLLMARHTAREVRMGGGRIKGH
ncbi:MAG: DUF188 domain-containing protein, partial [Peptostreptococcaceae bacterium]|nr:DUF188 domain-containing protein [Peptostreptococcaceae bacterium]